MSDVTLILDKDDYLESKFSGRGSTLLALIF